MSGLLVAVVPMLLILATIGLSRLEIWLGHDTVTATDVAEFLERAQGHDLRAPAQETPKALDYLHRRRILAINDAPAGGSYTGKHHAAPFLVSILSDATELGLSTRSSQHSQVSPSVNPTRHVNRV